MLSRVAYNIYWMQRYRERAENMARILEVSLIVNSDLPEEEMHWEPFLKTFAAFDLFQECYDNLTQENVFNFFTFDVRNPDSIINFIQKARENARTVREVITTEMWQELNTLHLYIQKESRSERPLVDPYHFFNRVKRQCQLITGIADTTMSRSLGWHFGRVGNLLERADMTSRLLDLKYFLVIPKQAIVGSPFDNIQWNALLKSVSGLEMYRKKWRSVHYTHVIQFLILDKDFPRSIHWCLDHCLQSLNEVDQRTTNVYASDAKRELKALITQLDQMDHQAIIHLGLHWFVDEMQAKLIKICNLIFDAFFNTSIEPGVFNEAAS